MWIDPGYSVIDSTVIKHDGTYYRFTKDERNNTSSTPCSKFIIEEKSTTILNLDYDFVADCIGKGAISRARARPVFKSNTENKWYLFIDEFGGRGYVPFETTDLDLRARGRRRPTTRCRPARATARCCRSPRPSTTGCSNGGVELTDHKPTWPGGAGPDRARNRGH